MLDKKPSLSVEALITSMTARIACSSDLQSTTSKQPALPREIVDDIFDFAIQGARDTRDPTITCNLLQVDYAARCQVIKDLGAVELYEVTPWNSERDMGEWQEGAPPPASISLPWYMIDRIVRLVRHELLLDFSMQREVAVPPLDEGEHAFRSIFAMDKSCVSSVAAKMSVVGHQVWLDDEALAQESFWDSVAIVCASDSVTVNLRDVLLAIQRAMVKLHRSPTFNAHHRTLVDVLQLRKSYVVVSLTLEFEVEPKNHPDAPAQRCPRTWCFTTHDAYPDP